MQSPNTICIPRDLALPFSYLFPNTSRARCIILSLAAWQRERSQRSPLSIGQCALESHLILVSSRQKQQDEWGKATVTVPSGVPENVPKGGIITRRADTNSHKVKVFDFFAVPCRKGCWVIFFAKIPRQRQSQLHIYTFQLVITPNVWYIFVPTQSLLG